MGRDQNVAHCSSRNLFVGQERARVAVSIDQIDITHLCDEMRKNELLFWGGVFRLIN